MEFFLERIARSLNDEFGNSLNRHCLVFPGRRSGLYFLKYLSAMLDKPVWAPSVLTINELFRSFSSLQAAGNEILLFELFKVYSSIKKNPGSFDEFYFWGDMLISDFDDTDKYLADPACLFENVKDIKQIDALFGVLTSDQQEVIRRFWSNFDPERITGYKSSFLNMWSLLFELYTGFRKSLREKNLSYEGMIFRDVAEMDKDELIASLNWDMVHFIGFNALNDCEKQLMKVFKNASKARFYWDYDNSFIGKGNYNSAGFFMSGNLETFGNDMPADWRYDTLISSEHSARRVVIETSSDVAQVKQVTELLSEIPGLSSDNAHHTAVVLSDESLLVPLLSSLPDNITDINITMGYPLRQSLAYTLIQNLLSLQRTSRENNGSVLFQTPLVQTILRHPLIKGLSGEPDKETALKLSSVRSAWINSDDFSESNHLKNIFSRHNTPLQLSAWIRNILSIIALYSDPDNDQSGDNIRNEMIYRIVLSLNRLDTVIRNNDVEFSPETYFRLLDRLLKSQSVPFSGEPLSGIQVMGILETRALDFKNLIILSVNEGVMPAVSSSSSFIPFSLRQAFGLPSVNHQESIYAYHFYRLLQRAENVVFTYNSNSEGLKSGEVSRFIIQMKYNDSLKPAFINTGFNLKLPSKPSEILNRTEEHISLLHAIFFNKQSRLLSPSAINTWLNCRMKFCFRYVYSIKEPDKIAADIDPALFGDIIHSVMKSLYGEFTGRIISREEIDDLLKNEICLRELINKTVESSLGDNEARHISGKELIVKEVIYRYVRRILNTDRAIAPIMILHLEEFLDFKLEIDYLGNKMSVRSGGYADRIDKNNGSTRIVDYKTGSASDSISSLSELFTDDRKKDIDGWLQTLLYCEAYVNKVPEARVLPAIYRIKNMTGSIPSYKLSLKDENVMVENYNELREPFIEGLTDVVNSIFNPDEPFTMTADRLKCRYCPYRCLCLR